VNNFKNIKILYKNMKQITDELITAYALKNATEHEGKAVAGSILSPLFHEGLEKSKVKEIMPKVNSILKKINSLSPEEQKKEFTKHKEQISHRTEREGLPELDNTKVGKIITRISPSPSGPMHIGHAATGMPNSLYAKKYKGKFIVRIEDTNPDNIYKPAYRMIKEECDWLFENVTEYTIQSDRLKTYYKYAKELIEKASAYICDCNPEKFKELITKKKPCPCRDISSKENLKRWEKMLDKKEYKQGEVVLRFKSDIKNPNPALRDFPLARINETRHPRQKNKYRVWPLMNLSVFVDDLESNVTHAIRAKEHQDNAKRQEMMFKVMKKTPPTSYFIGRYKFTDLEISASKTKEKIEAGKFNSWGDIRLPFLAQLKKRGYQPKAFAIMAEERGLSPVDKTLTKEEYFDLLSNINREIIRRKATTLETGKNKATLRTPDNKAKKLQINQTKLKDQTIYFIKNVGYAQFNKKENELWFTHK